MFERKRIELYDVLNKHIEDVVKRLELFRIDNDDKINSVKKEIMKDTQHAIERFSISLSSFQKEINDNEIKVDNKIDNKIAKLTAKFTDEITDKITKLTDEITPLKTNAINFEGVYKNDLERLRIEFQRELVKFHKEISDKYFQGLESIFKYTKEIQLIDSLSKNTNDNDFKVLKSALMQPLLEHRYKADKEQTGAKVEKIVTSKFTAIVDERNKLHDEFIVLQRQGKNVRFQEGKLEVLNKIIEEAKNEKVS